MLPLLLNAKSQEFLVLCCLGLGFGDTRLLDCHSTALPLQSQRSHKPLDLRCLAPLLACGRYKAATIGVDVFPHIILLGEIEELANFGGSLRTPHSGLLNISESRQVIITLLDDNQVQHREVWANDASPHGLTPPLPVAPPVSPEARDPSVHQELHTALSENSLLHWETLLVAASHDLEDIPLELISQLVTADLLGQSLVVELAKLSVVIDLNLLLAPRSGVGDVELHGAGDPMGGGLSEVRDGI